MDLSARHPVLRTKLGNDGFLELRDILDSHEREWRKRVLETATDRFERRLTEEIATVRVSLIRWMFGFFVAYLGVTLSLVGMILHAAKLL
jgi:hypothetical protein